MIEVISYKFPNAEIIGVDSTEDSMKFAMNRFKRHAKIKFKVGQVTNIPRR